MTKMGSVKETGEEISDEKWRRFEAATGVGQDRRSRDDVQTDQLFREEAEGDTPSRSDSNEAREPDRKQGATKTTERTE